MILPILYTTQQPPAHIFYALPPKQHLPHLQNQNLQHQLVNQGNPLRKEKLYIDTYKEMEYLLSSDIYTNDEMNTNLYSNF